VLSVKIEEEERMIPAVAFIIAGYVVFRMVEVFLFADNRYASKMSRMIAAVLAVLVTLWTLMNTFDVYLSASRSSNPLGR